MSLKEVLKAALVDGLNRKAATKCSRWSELYRVMGPPLSGPYSYKYHPWTREMHDCDSDVMVGQKAAQMGFTEVALNKTFYHIDMRNESVLYILPSSHPGASDFSTSRFDPALELSPHLSNLFSNVKNIGHKRAGNANLYIRGSRSREQLKSIPVSLAIADELEEMVQENIALIPERMSGHERKQMFLLSTPSVPNFGINSHYKNSTEEHYFFRCPRCSRWIELLFPECLIITSEDKHDIKIKDSYLICNKCKGSLPHKEKTQFLQEAEWVPTHKDRISRGFHVNQLYSSTVKPYEIAIKYINSQLNPTDEQEFFNSVLGLPHEVQGARVLDSDIDAATGTFTKYLTPPNSGFITMGVDVGTWLHYEIDQWLTPEKCTLIMEGKVKHFREIYDLFVKYQCSSGIIDANPERRAAKELCEELGGLMKMCFYVRGITGKDIKQHSDEANSVSVDRTSWMDAALGRYHNRTITVPRDLSMEYREHIKTPIRVYEKDKDGNPIGRYVKPDNAADHLAHARTYSEIACALGSNLGGNQNIRGIL